MFQAERENECSMSDRRERELDAVEPGMRVETTDGDLGEHDITRPVVKDVMRSPGGDVEKVIVEKGAIFKKTLAVPPGRVEEVRPEDERGDGGRGSLTITTNPGEVDTLTPAGAEELPARGPANPGDDDDSLLGEVQEEVPTVEGLRRKEAETAASAAWQTRATADSSREQGRLEHTATREERQQLGEREGRGGFSLRSLGPGFLAGMSGNDPTAVTAYAVNGAMNGYGQLWLMLLATPLFQAVQYACAKIGRVTQLGLADLLSAHYGRRMAGVIAGLLVVANVALIAGDLTAIGSGIELVTGVRWTWFVVPVAVALWYLTVYENFGMLKKVFVVMSLAFVAYIATGVLAHPDWGRVLAGTFVPHVGLDFASVSSAVALLGATLTPYSMFWQAQGEKEEARPGPLPRQLRLAALDVGTGTLGGNVVAYFIIVSTSATLFAHHRTITTATDAARALEPLLGPFAKYLFAAGLIGAGLVAIPILLASTSYAVSGTFGWTASLWRKPWQSEGFYLILTAALAASLVVALLGIDPLQLIFWANVLQGVLAPVLVVVLLLAGNNRAVMRGRRLGWPTNVLLGIAAAVLIVAAALFFYGLATGQGE